MGHFHRRFPRRFPGVFHVAYHSRLAWRCRCQRTIYKAFLTALDPLFRPPPPPRNAVKIVIISRRRDFPDSIRYTILSNHFIYKNISSDVPDPFFPPFLHLFSNPIQFLSEKLTEKRMQIASQQMNFCI